jgi:hypothetical protein
LSGPRGATESKFEKIESYPLTAESLDWWSFTAPPSIHDMRILSVGGFEERFSSLEAAVGVEWPISKWVSKSFPEWKWIPYSDGPFVIQMRIVNRKLFMLQNGACRRCAVKCSIFPPRSLHPLNSHISRQFKLFLDGRSSFSFLRRHNDEIIARQWIHLFHELYWWPRRRKTSHSQKHDWYHDSLRCSQSQPIIVDGRVLIMASLIFHFGMLNR